MKVRAAIAGAGAMGFWHARSIVGVGGDVVLICDLDSGSAQRLASRFKGARACSRLDEDLEREKIDILHVCTPSSTHFELASNALRRGIHVLVEKPMTSRCSETDALYKLAAEHGVLLCPVHQFAFQRGVRSAVTMLGRLGQLRHFEATFCSAGGADKTGSELDEIVWEILPHPLSLMQLFGPGGLRGQDWTVSYPAVGEFRATLTARGVSFSILISMNSRPTVAALNLRGTAATVHVDLFHGFSFIEPGTVSRWRKLIRPFDVSLRTTIAAGLNIVKRASTFDHAYPGLHNLIQHFYAAIASGSPPPVQGSDVIEIAAARDLLVEKSKAISRSIEP